MYRILNISYYLPFHPSSLFPIPLTLPFALFLMEQEDKEQEQEDRDKWDRDRPRTKLINDFFKLKFDKNLTPAGQTNKTSEAIREKVFFLILKIQSDKFRYTLFFLLLSNHNEFVLFSIVPVTYKHKLGPYLAGLITPQDQDKLGEGDGTIVVPIKKKTYKGNNNYGYIQICFSIKDLPLAQYLQILLGGHINLRLNSGTLTFKSKDNVFRVINLINGYASGEKPKN